MQEVWKPVFGYDNLYEVSNLGRVRSFPRNGTVREVRILKQQIDRHGYPTVCLRDVGKINRKVHHLVLEAFKGQRAEGQECRHLDGVRTNNEESNLEWGTKLENAEDSIRHGTNFVCPRGEEHYNSLLSEQDVIDIWNSDLSQEDLAQVYNISQSHISQIKRGIIWSHVTQGLSKSIRTPKSGDNKLTEQIVRQIYADPNSQQDIADRFGVHQTLVSAIKRGKVWSHVTKDLPIATRKQTSSDRKLTAEAAKQIFQSEGTQQQIANVFGVTQGLVSAIKRGKVWAHVTNNLTKEIT